jgi:hypothetical protein
MAGGGVTLFTVDMKRLNTEAAGGSDRPQPWLPAGVGDTPRFSPRRRHLLLLDPGSFVAGPAREALPGNAVIWCGGGENPRIPAAV